MTSRGIAIVALGLLGACTRAPITPSGAGSTPPQSSLVVLQAPLPITPADESKQPVRPTLRVVNSARTGQAEAITYRFELAIDAAFTAVVASGTVPEGEGTTSFTTPMALAHATTYFWHAQAIDSFTRTSSPVSATRALTTTVADDGVFPYVLELTRSSGCPSNSTPLTQFIDGVLTVNDALASFAPTRAPYDAAPWLAMGLTRQGARVTGTIEGGAFSKTQNVIDVARSRIARQRDWTVGTSPAALTGSVSAPDRFDGTFDGYLYVANIFGDGGACESSLHRWSLHPPL